MYDVPVPPKVADPCNFGLLLLADREPLETFYVQLEAVRSQTLEQWRLFGIGIDPARRRVVERATASDLRIQWMEALPGESLAEAERRIALSLDTEWIVLLSKRGLLHPRTLEWFASAGGHTTAVAFITDEEAGTRKSGFAERSSPNSAKSSITRRFLK